MLRPDIGGRKGASAMVLKVTLFLLALYALLSWVGARWRKRVAFDPGYREIHFAETSDGWRIALHRYPAIHPGRCSIPVVLCHGLGANRFNFDLGPEVSLARYLQDHGYDVWSMDLRGRGNSWYGGEDPRANRRGGTFDDYVERDAAAAVAYVRRKTGVDRVHWVGHSMGGLILYAFLQGDYAEQIASGVAIASPGDFSGMGEIPYLASAFRGFRLLPFVPVSFLAAGLAPLLARFGLRRARLFVNPDNVETVIKERALCFLVSGISRGEVEQFSDWIRNGEFRSLDGGRSYRENLGRVKAPLLLMAGSADYLCPEETIEAVYRRISSHRKAFRVVGKRSGETADYGHGDLLIGRRCREEVFPLVREWLESFSEE